MAKNKLTDLNNHLFAQMERLGDENLKPDEMDLEIRKSKSIVMVSEQIIKNARLTFEVAKSVSGGELKTVPEQLETKRIE